MEEHDRIADSYEQEADKIEQPSKELESEIKEVREDWDQKTKTERVPGAMELPDEDDEPQPNTYEFEERTPETAEARGPQEEEPDDSESEDSGDS